MSRKFLGLAVLSLFISVPALAHGHGPGHAPGHGKRKRNACFAAKITQEQRVQIRTAMKEFRTQNKTEKAAAQAAAKAYRQVVFNEASTPEEITAAAEAAATARAAVGAKRLTFVANLSKEVFSGEQLKPGFRCLQQRLGKRKGPHGKKKRRGPGRRRGPRA